MEIRQSVEYISKFILLKLNYSGPLSQSFPPRINSWEYLIYFPCTFPTTFSCSASLWACAGSAFSKHLLYLTPNIAGLVIMSLVQIVVSKTCLSQSQHDLCWFLERGVHWKYWRHLDWSSVLYTSRKLDISSSELTLFNRLCFLYLNRGFHL